MGEILSLLESDHRPGQHHIINDFIFPGSPSSSYTWNTFRQDELICLQLGGNDKQEIPCLLLQGVQNDSQTLMSRPASTILIYCHANSEDLGSIYACAQWISQMLGVHVLVPEFPGYGLCRGSPCEASVNRAVIAACTFARDALMMDPSRIIIYGRSIGTGPSVFAARKGCVGGLVLISPYTSIRDLVEEHVGSVISILATGSSEWDSVNMIEQVTVPTLLIHGTDDDIIPSKHSELLYERCRSKKKLVLLDNVGHQEMDLLYALVQTLPEIHPVPLSSHPIRLSDLESILVEKRLAGSTDEESKFVPVYKIADLSIDDNESDIGERVIGGKHVLLV